MSAAKIKGMIKPIPAIPRRGFTLTEMAMVLGIIGVVLGGIWVAAASAHSSMLANTTAKQVVTLAQNVRSFYAGRTQIAASLIGGSLNSILEKSNVFPPEMQQTVNAPPMNVYGGTVGVYAIASNTFRISYYSLTSLQCVQVLTNVIRISSSTSGVGPTLFGSWYTAPAVGNAPPVAYGAARTVTITPGMVFTPDMAVAACGNYSTDTVSAEFNFTL